MIEALLTVAPIIRYRPKTAPRAAGAVSRDIRELGVALGGVQGWRLVRYGSLADAAVDPLAEQIGVAEVAGVLLDHVEYHLAQRDGRAVFHGAADGEVG